MQLSSSQLVTGSIEWPRSTTALPLGGQPFAGRRTANFQLIFREDGVGCGVGGVGATHAFLHAPRLGKEPEAPAEVGSHANAGNAHAYALALGVGTGGVGTRGVGARGVGTRGVGTRGDGVGCFGAGPTGETSLSTICTTPFDAVWSRCMTVALPTWITSVELRVTSND